MRLAFVSACIGKICLAAPDLVFPRHRLAVFVNGCFWHRHAGCRFAYSPKSRVVFWEEKFRGNVARDRRNEESLLTMGWRVLVVWECETRDEDAVRQKLAKLTFSPVSHVAPEHRGAARERNNRAPAEA